MVNIIIFVLVIELPIIILAMLELIGGKETSEISEEHKKFLTYMEGVKFNPPRGLNIPSNIVGITHNNPLIGELVVGRTTKLMEDLYNEDLQKKSVTRRLKILLNIIFSTIIVLILL